MNDIPNYVANNLTSYMVSIKYLGGLTIHREYKGMNGEAVRQYVLNSINIPFTQVQIKRYKRLVSTEENVFYVDFRR